ncbi:ABC transporter permease [Gimesia chilikensis]|uniref:Macrolide export ATP-binding/permease protein MacB n=1 Tax=Gimesia chilikensis TaxID=2605989 RepID=A0A517PS15_9PLAN|nr:ABC transporter permease [Gimesia chilikensis]QDT22167.1 Macrolide export ATP-binding/permease protein MacB [Gimesia chilikensis]
MLKFAFRNLLSRSLRSFLCLMGLTIAIAGMVGLFSIAGGLEKTVAQTFGKISGIVAMQPGAPIPLFSRVPRAWGEEIKTIPGVAIVNPEIWSRVNIIDGKPVVSPPRFLFGTDLPTRTRLKHGIYRDSIYAGRFLDLNDQGQLNAVISRQIAEQHEKQVGDTIEVNGQDLQIIGLYETDSILLDVAIILDINVVREITRFDPESVSCFYIEQTGEIKNDPLVESIKDQFRDRELASWQPASLALANGSSSNLLKDLMQSLDQGLKGNPPAESKPNEAEVPVKKQSAKSTEANIKDREQESPSALEVRAAADWGDRLETFTADLDIFLGLLTGIGVLIAMLSIINTMLMSVMERIVDFGILKANGWSNRDVMLLITAESSLLGVVGGVLGGILGLIAIAIVNWKFADQIHLYASPGLLLFGVFFSTSLGVLGGLYPAWWTTRMTPIDAIRRG